MSTKRSLDLTASSKAAQLLAQKFASLIVGQPEATIALTSVIEKYQSGLYDRTKPLASLLFLGPTGTGKTATVEAFAEGLFGSPATMLKIDCAEYQHSHEISRLVGSPPGYLGHRETKPAITTEKLFTLRTFEFPFSIVLFDEIEKASDALWNLLLSILDKGALTLGTNDHVDMRSTIIIMTSNVGSKELADQVGDGVLGFLTPTGEVSGEKLKNSAVSAAKRKFMPEFLNRLDDIVMFNTLSRLDLEAILDIELRKLDANILANAKANVGIIVTPAARAEILAEGYDRKYGARFLKRVIEKRITMPVTRAISTEQVICLDRIVVDFKKEFRYLVE